MKEQGLRWNAEKKEVEKMRWRAESEAFYYFVDEELDVVAMTDDDDKYDGSLWNNYNYFQTKEQTKEATRRIREVLLRYHEEIGE